MVDLLNSDEIGNPGVRLCEIIHDAGSCGFNVSKSKWDPYPWVSTVEADSPAAAAGVQPGDCLLEVNGDDMLGLRVAQVASRVKARGDRATVMLWNPGIDQHCNSDTLCCGPMPNNLQRLVTCLTNIVEALECPVCLETTQPPAHQCVNGHIICLKCRTQTDRCPVCRVRLFRGRSLLSDQIFTSLMDAFDLQREDESSQVQLLHQKVYGLKAKEKKKRPDIKINFLTPTNKFLSRLMGSGKSSSVENLSIIESVSDNNSSGLKAKSLSSSEISKATVIGSSLSLTSRPGSGLLDVHDHKRPASYHGSAEQLRWRLIDELALEMEPVSWTTSVQATRLCCPMAPACNLTFEASSLKNHLRHHQVPIIHFSQSKISFSPNWLKEAIGIVHCFGTLFFIRCNPSDKIWVWTVDEVKAQYTATVKLNNDRALHCGVLSLTDLTAPHQLASCGITLQGLLPDEPLLLSIRESPLNSKSDQC